MIEQLELNRVIQKMIKSDRANLHTMTIGRVITVNAESIDVQPVINRIVNGESIALPVFKNVPPVFLQGGATYEAFPITAGDYCLLMVNERSFDKWYSGQDEVEPIEQRLHDYSDCFALCGVNPLSSAKTIPSDKIVREGNTKITGDIDQTGNLTITGDVDLTGNHTQTGDMEITGNLTVNGNIICSGVITMASMIIGGAGGTPVDESFFTGHTHSQNGGGNTGVPN